MPQAWTFEHSVNVRATREAAWAFWSDVSNWSVVDPAVEWARLDGPFEAGTHGRTKPVGAPATDWTLAAVEAGRSATIEIVAPGAVVRFTWTLRDGERGWTTLTQRVELEGDGSAQYLDAAQALAHNIPVGMEKLVAAIEGVSTGPPN
jgi:hypothetical protein